MQAQLLRFITCGSVDDGKSTLIGRLLVDSRAVLQDQLAGVQRHGQTDLALLTDGLSAEREQGITIDVAHRYFSTASRKFIIGDTPGHEQYTRNMVTAASQADAAVLLVDATKLDWKQRLPTLLAQTRRHALLAHLLRVPSLVFAVNKLDAVADAQAAFRNISEALRSFATQAGLAVVAIVPVSALKGWNVVDREQPAGWCDYAGPTLLQILEQLPVRQQDAPGPLVFPVQWVENFSGNADTTQGRRLYWGRVASGQARVGQRVLVMPGGQRASVARVLSHNRESLQELDGRSGALVLDRELDISRGDWLLADDGAAPEAGLDSDGDAPAAPSTRNVVSATIAWLDNENLAPGRAYWALHGHRWVKARVTRVLHRLDIHTLEKQDADSLEPNAIGEVELLFQEALHASAYRSSRALGAMVLVDTRTHNTAAALMVH
jgi:sulfate adenylyltransferase subunit 1